MRRARTSIALVMLLMAGGVACFAAEANRSPAGMAALQPGLLAGGGLLLLSAVAALLALWRLSADCRRVARHIRQIQSDDAPPDLARTASHLPELRDAVSEVLTAADEARQKARELDIQLRVATAARRHAEGIIHSISDAVLVTDQFDELVLANESAARMFGFELAEASRAPVDQVLPDRRVVELIREMRQSSSRLGRRVVEHSVRNGHGERSCKLTLSCVRSEGSDENSKTDIRDSNFSPNPPCGVVAVLHDMTREKEVAQMKNDFVSNVSHELRTPLAGIKAYVEMLIDGEAEDEKTRRDFYEVIQGEANRLGRLIDNILNISRIESGLVQVNKQPLSLMVVLKEAIEVIAPQARMKRIKLQEQLTPAIYQTVGDRDMLYQAALNLLSNAVKYTPEGGTVTVQTCIDEGRRRISARICDSGVGIPAKELPHVFDKFYRVESNSRMAKGTGLGLSLVKQIIEVVHQGRMFVESEVGRGSCFGFELELCE